MNLWQTEWILPLDKYQLLLIEQGLTWISLNYIDKSELSLVKERPKKILNQELFLLFMSTATFRIPFQKSIDQRYSVSIKSSIIPPKYITSTRYAFPTKKCSFVSFFINWRGLPRQFNVLELPFCLSVSDPLYSWMFFELNHVNDLNLVSTLGGLI